MKNPFKFGTVVKGEDFCDREKDMKNIMQALESGMSVSIISPRRYGKTSLIVNTMEKMEGYRKVYMDLMGITSVDEFLGKYSSAVLESLGGMKKFLSNLENLIKVKGKMSLNLKALKVDFEVNSSQDVESVVELSTKFKDKFIIVMDEFQEIVNVTDVDLITILRKKFQFFDNTVFAFLGSKRSMMRKIFSNPQKPFYRFTQVYELAPLEKTSLLKFMKRKFKEVTPNLPEEVYSRIYDITKGHPYYFQALCYHLWFLANEKGELKVEDVEKALEKAIFAEEGAFENIWDKLTPNGKKVLKALAQDVPPYSLKMSAGSVKRSLESLENSDVVMKKSGYDVLDPIFKIWIRSKL